jgi:hypothetical protein
MKNGLLRFLVSALATIPKLSGIKVDCFFYFISTFNKISKLNDYHN